MKVLVCGGRDFRNEAWVRATLDGLHAHFVIKRVISGGAVGADRFASRWADEKKGVESAVYEADWQANGRHTAGFIRNQQMLDLETPDIVIGFPGGTGTSDMMERARADGFHTIWFQKGGK